MSFAENRNASAGSSNRDSQYTLMACPLPVKPWMELCGTSGRQAEQQTRTDESTTLALGSLGTGTHLGVR